MMQVPLASGRPSARDRHGAAQGSSNDINAFENRRNGSHIVRTRTQITSLLQVKYPLNVMKSAD